MIALNTYNSLRVTDVYADSELRAAPVSAHDAALTVSTLVDKHRFSVILGDEAWDAQVLVVGDYADALQCQGRDDQQPGIKSATINHEDGNVQTTFNCQRFADMGQLVQRCYPSRPHHYSHDVRLPHEKVC